MRPLTRDGIICIISKPLEDYIVHIIISEIPEKGLILSYEEDPLPLPEGARVEGKIGVFLKIYKVGLTVSISGEVRANLGLECSRCLKEFSCPIISAFTVNYIPIHQIEREGEYELKRGDLDLNFYRGDKIDLSDLIKEQLLLSLSMQPLCSPDCKGLCSRCGMPLSEGPCICEIKEIDPRLAVLKKLKG